MSVVASFKSGLKRAFTKPVYRYDYGQKLVIENADLPETFIVHFSNTEELGVATTAIGSNNEVMIPNEYLRHNWDHIFAFIYIGDQNSGQTEYQIVIPIKNRPATVDPVPSPMEEDIIVQTIAAMNRVADKAETLGETLERLEESAGIIFESEDLLNAMNRGFLLIDGGDAEYVVTSGGA